MKKYFYMSTTIYLLNYSIKQNRQLMNLYLPSWIPRDPAILQGCIDEEFAVLDKLEKKVTQIESKSKQPPPFSFWNPNEAQKLPYQLHLTLLNSVIYSSPIRDYQVIELKREEDIGSSAVYIATAHEIHIFHIPICRNNPIIEIPDVKSEISSFVINPFSNHLFVLFENNEVYPYSLKNFAWKRPLNLQTDGQINTMQRMNNFLCFQCGDNEIIVVHCQTLDVFIKQTIATDKIVESYFPLDRTTCFLLTNESKLIMFDIETKTLNSIPLDVLTERNIFISHITSQLCGSFIYAYNSTTIIKYDPHFQWQSTFSFGTKQLFVESEFMYLIYNPKYNHNESSNTDEDSNLEDKYYLIISSLSEHRFFVILSINNIDVESFKIIYTKQGERHLLIRGNDNSISIWTLTFSNPSKDEHGAMVKAALYPEYMYQALIPQTMSREQQQAQLRQRQLRPPSRDQRSQPQQPQPQQQPQLQQPQQPHLPQQQASLIIHNQPMPTPIPIHMIAQNRQTNTSAKPSPTRRIKSGTALIPPVGPKQQPKPVKQGITTSSPGMPNTDVPMPVAYQQNSPPMLPFSTFPVGYTCQPQRIPISNKSSPDSKATRQAYLIHPPMSQFSQQRIFGIMPAQSAIPHGALIQQSPQPSASQQPRVPQQVAPHTITPLPQISNTIQQSIQHLQTLVQPVQPAMPLIQPSVESSQPTEHSQQQDQSPQNDT